jgi:pyruvate formate lyase activating enzyme
MAPDHEAMFYRVAEGQDVDCYLCGHGCRIAEGKRGFCQVRENREGKLYSLVYGRPIALHMDPIEKKPLYHFLPGTLSFSIATPGCNFRCTFCQNWQISQVDAAPAFSALEYQSPERIVQRAVGEDARSIAYTYTEPTIFMEYALDCAGLAAKHGLKNVFVTNGYESPQAVKAMAGLIDAANVDLKAFSEDFYRRKCRAKLQPVLDAIQAMYDAGIHVEVTTLLVPGQNDSEEELSGLASFLAGISTELPWHVSRFHPDYQETDTPATPMKSMLRALEAGKNAGLDYVYLGNVLSEEGQNTRCPDCGRLLIGRSGFSRATVTIDEPSCPDCGRHVGIVFD